MAAPRKALLLVEDDDLLRAVLEEYLVENGFEVHAVGDGAEALDLLISDGVRPAAIVMDLRMPAMNGWELLAVLAQDGRLARVPKIVMTGVSDHGLGDERRTAVLIKPFVSTELVRELERVCEGTASGPP